MPSGWELHLGGAVRVYRARLSSCASVLCASVLCANGCAQSMHERLLKLGVEDQSALGLPLRVCPGSAESVHSPEDLWLRWRAHAGAVHWHQDGDGTKRTEGWLTLWYLRGSASLAFRRAAEHSCAVTLLCAPGTLVIFGNTALEHAVESGAPRAFLGPWPVWPEAGPAPSPATPSRRQLLLPHWGGNVLRPQVR